MLTSVWLNELTWEDVDGYLKNRDTVLIPIGSTEQHGTAPRSPGAACATPGHTGG